MTLLNALVDPGETGTDDLWFLLANGTNSTRNKVGFALVLDSPVFHRRNEARMNKRTLRKRAAAFTILSLIGLLAVPTLLTWRELRQERLNHALIAAVDRNDAIGVASLLKRGANANTTVEKSYEVDHFLWPVSLTLRDPVVPTPSPLERLLTYWRSRVHPDPDGFIRHLPLLCNACEVEGKNGAVIRILLNYGADVNATDEFGASALCCAAARGNNDAVGLLLDRGASIDAPDADGSTPLIAAVGHWHESTVRLLLSHHADMTRRNKYGDTALSLIQGSKPSEWGFTQQGKRHIAQMLEQAGAKETDAHP